MQKITCAGTIIYTRKNSTLYYLLIHNTQGHWDLPKGKQENHESLIETAQRETAEETGVIIEPADIGLTPLRYTYIFNGKEVDKTVTFFVAQVPSQCLVTLSDEHDDSGWFTHEQALTKIGYPETQALLTQAHTTLNKQ